MNRNRKGAKRRGNALRVWSYDAACHALPYVTSVMGSLREHWLDAQAHDRRARQLADLPGRPDRGRLLAQQEANARSREAQERFDLTAQELHDLDIFCIDPLRGEGAIPFVHDEQLAWFIYDLFAPNTLLAWRYHTDSLDIRRPIAETLAGPDEAPRVA